MSAILDFFGHSLEGWIQDPGLALNSLVTAWKDKLILHLEHLVTDNDRKRPGVRSIR
jgi:hypothetical protein